MTDRREQRREATARHRKRTKRGMFWRPILVTKDQLDELEVRRFLDPNGRGERLYEAEAMEAFLKDALVKTKRPPSGPSNGYYGKDKAAPLAVVTKG